MLERDVRATNSFAHSLAAGLVRMGSNLHELSGRGSSGRAQTQSIKTIMVHVNDPSKGGCDFGTFFGTTPQGLIEEGIYKEIAIALHTPPHRAVSLALVAEEQTFGVLPAFSLPTERHTYNLVLILTRLTHARAGLVNGPY